MPTPPRRLNKEEGIRISLSAITSLLLIIPVVWFLLKPLIADSLAEDTKQIVKQEIKPMNAAFEILMRDMIQDLGLEIADLEFTQAQAHLGQGKWTIADNRKLQELRDELVRNEEVLDALREGR